ncbi:hypothetical protein AXF42_Ash012453 [Apostasia shenzhenica]|uniref:Uncharacterized protein n=1 Tax=Apostasia shenzhenica TaxID=1088818 RepID=A0A2I0AQU3_9ASPA|nr:hypothetical protein AXF42_Ash012453 [Apostasia shenzhenica]
MASICRSALSAGRSAAVRSKGLLSSPSSSRRAACLVSSSRLLVSALVAVDSLQPLHNAIASSRLVSDIAVDTSYWGSLSRGLALPS